MAEVADVIETYRQALVEIRDYEHAGRMKTLPESIMRRIAREALAKYESS